ncbi:hypothetical protein BX589_115162 [Paraburkholderia fungorum]|jgi:hypothetical protein|uniref:hypothetical protein n=1 Tax=Paraburkholderia fungorum TaxID=134537 RepID=UPI000D44AFA8|nr:hypothetical protein [Paraburkholderia fungorum]PRZ52282.1 hypothetical protein BX589_115162 [Paraburkholderia fungorum]
MNSSLHIVSGGESVQRHTPRPGYDVTRFEEGPDLMTMMRDRCTASPPFSITSTHRALSDENGSADQRPPTTVLHAQCSGHESRIVRFLNGPDSPGRTERLRSRLIELAGGRCHELQLCCMQAELGDRLRSVIAALHLRPFGRFAFVAIDGIDQRPTSPSSIALQLTTLANAGATIICSVDGRYGDAHLLKFHLRALGIRVVCESLSLCLAAAAHRESPWASRVCDTQKKLNNYAFCRARSASYGQQGHATAVGIDQIARIDVISDNAPRLASEVPGILADRARVICAVNCNAREWRDIKYAFHRAGVNPIEEASPVRATLGVANAQPAYEVSVPARLFPRTTCIALKAYRRARKEHVVETAAPMCDERGHTKARQKDETINATELRLAPELSKRAAFSSQTRADHERLLRERFAAAYFNPFAISRLLAERKR